MPVARLALVEILAKLAPALAKDERIPVLTNFWFTGQEAMAFNDVIAVAVPWPSDFKGAVPGKALFALLTASAAKDVTLAKTGAGLGVKAGRMNAKLALMPEESYQ